MTAGERDEVFTELLDRVLQEPEITEAMAGDHVPSVQDLRESAFDERDSLLGQSQVRAIEERYREATDQIGALQSKRWRIRVVFWGGGTIALLIALAASVVMSWNEELTASLTARRSPSVASIVFHSILGFLGFVLVGSLCGALVLWLSERLSRRVRVGEPWALETTNRWSIRVAIAVPSFAVAGAAMDVQPLLWQLVHDRPVGAHYDPSWGGVVGFAAAAVFAAPFVTLVGRFKVLDTDTPEMPFASQLRSLFLGTDDAGRDEINRLRAAWRDALSAALLGFMRSQISAYVARRYATRLDIKEASGLRQVRGPSFHVTTPAEKALVTAANGMDGGSIALAGPRGVGKTELLKAFCRDGSDRLGLELSAPVVYDRREFMLRLFARLCEHVISTGLEAKAEAARHLQRIHYLRTRTGEAGVSMGWKGFGLSAKRGSSRARQPLTYPEIVDSLKGFLQVTANELRPRRRLVIGIDELDRIEPASHARDFINELKVVFDVPYCLFILSVSDETLRESDLVSFGRRDAFDSAIDETIRVEPLDQATAIKLLDTRAIGLPLPFIALFFCLSGGMPRDLLRTARAAAALSTSNDPRTLPQITGALLNREKARLANAWDISSASYAIHRDFLRTLEQIFSADLAQERLTKASDVNFPGSFEALAQVRRHVGITDASADSTLRQVRLAWELPDIA